MIAPMDQLLLVARKTITHDLLRSLQRLGVVHVDGLDSQDLQQLVLSQPDQQDKERWESIVARSEALLDTLGLADDANIHAAVALDSQDPADLQHYLAELSEQSDACLAERADIRDELEVIAGNLPFFQEFAPSMALLEGSRYLYGAAFLVPAGDTLDKLSSLMHSSFDERFLLTLSPFGKNMMAVAVVLQSEKATLLEVLAKLGLASLQLPARYASYGIAEAVQHMQAQQSKLPQRLEELEQTLRDLAVEHAGKLRAVQQLAHNHSARYTVMQQLGEGNYSVALQGWVPSADCAAVVQALQNQFPSDVVVEARPANEHVDHHVPTKLDNPDWIKPFEGLLSLFAPPKYGNFDPSWTLAVFFPFFFGLVVGDIGFGLLFLAIALWLRKRGAAGKALSLGPLGITLTPQALPSIGAVIMWCSAWSMAWGLLYGEFFGNFLEKWPASFPIFYVPGHAHGHEAHGLIPIALFRVENYTPLLLLSIGFGAFQVLYGWFLRSYYGYKHNDSHHLWEGLGMFSGLVGVIVFSYAFLSNALNPFVLAFVTLSLAIFLLAVVQSGVILMIVELISNSGNILSYLRLFAVGLSAALVANLATDLGFALGGTLPIIGPLLGIVVGLSVHLLAIALTIIGHTLQPLRLQYVEFFTKFGFYDEEGRPYKPFRLLGGKV